MKHLSKNMKNISLILFLGIISIFQANATNFFFYIQLKDKANSPYNTSKPSDYLSERAIARRAYYNIPIDETDLPVNSAYIKELNTLGATVYNTTKWLNGVTVAVQDSSIMQKVRKLKFVKFVQYTGLINENITRKVKQKSPAQNLNFNYGQADYQLDFINGKALHTNGYNGEGMHIAVIDAGFDGVNTNDAFKIMQDEKRLLGTKDFINPNSDIYSTHTHGAYVLATMAAELNNTFVGTAPKASYWLLRSEVAIGEYLFEPDFWISAIEFADSVGVDVATTSLGYTQFDDSSMNYTYETLNGNTARASIAANMAYKKGILLFNSAGNDGNKSWKYISVPADAEAVITVGALNNDSTLSSFSSLGLPNSKVIKPELVVQGSRIKTLKTNAFVTTNSGTSFATPILAGAATCFLQAAKSLYPNHTLDQIKKIIFQSANQYDNPDYSMGYGIPNFEKALKSLNKATAINITTKYKNDSQSFKIFVNRNSQNFNLILEDNNVAHTARIYQIDGKMLIQKRFSTNTLNIDLSNLQEGIYILKIEK